MEPSTAYIVTAHSADDNGLDYGDEVVDVAWREWDAKEAAADHYRSTIHDEDALIPTHAWKPQPQDDQDRTVLTADMDGTVYNITILITEIY